MACPPYWVCERNLTYSRVGIGKNGALAHHCDGAKRNNCVIATNQRCGRTATAKTIDAPDRMLEEELMT